jgi:hypothetical protein
MTHVISKKYHCAALTQRKFGLVIGGDKVVGFLLLATLRIVVAKIFCCLAVHLYSSM